MNTTTRQAMKLQEIAGRIDSFATEQAAANAELVEAQERMRRFAEQRTNIEAEITSAAAKLETARVALAAAIEKFEPGDTEAAAVAAAKLTLVGLEERRDIVATSLGKIEMLIPSIRERAYKARIAHRDAGFARSRLIAEEFLMLAFLQAVEEGITPADLDSALHSLGGIGWDRRAAELIIGKAKVLLSVADGDADEVEGALTDPAREDNEGDGPVIGADVTEVN